MKSSFTTQVEGIVQLQQYKQVGLVNNQVKWPAADGATQGGFDKPGQQKSP